MFAEKDSEEPAGAQAVPGDPEVPTVCFKFVLAPVVPEKIPPALFTLKNGDDRFTELPINPNPRNIDPVRRTRGANFHRATTKTPLIRPEQTPLL